MHEALVQELLEREVAAVRDNDFLLERIDSIVRAGHDVQVRCTPNLGGVVLLCLTGADYDSHPLGLRVLDPDSGAELPGASWPGQLYFGSDHPVLGRPFCCLRGLLEYHLHPSHVADPWGRLRFELRLPTLVGHLLNKAGVA
jgi:hypothetical protein